MKKEKGKNTKGFLKKSVTGVIAGALALTMAVGIMQPAVETYAAGKTTNIGGFSAVMIADPDTSEDDHIFNGTPAEDGKIWTDKSVTTGAMFGINAEEDNFTVALSAIAQTYNTVETAMSTDEEKYAFDVVFVLDFSGSMNYGMQSNSNSNATIGSTRADAMVKALNPAIATLMKNENSRIAVVGYSGSNVNSSSAATILSLDHYTASNSIYFTYGANNSRQISIASGVKDSSGNTESGYKAVNGGTPTQRGIYHGMTILQNASHPKDGVTRIPVMILLTDGKAGSAKPTYTTLSGNTLYEGDANNGYDDEEVGAYTILTANYAKTQIQSAYNKIYQYEDASMGAKFYTIGLGIGATEWTHFMLDPGTTEANGDNVVSGNRGIKYYLNNDATYKNNYDYADNCFVGQMTEKELKQKFESIVNELTIDSTISSTINPPISHESGEIGSENITFTDYLGYKMELKGDSQYLRYDGINYRFDKQSNNTYVFSGYDWGGNAVTGPALTINGTTYTLANVTFQTEFVNEQYNGQTGYWKVTWSFPSALLPTYSRLNNYDSTNVDPIRMIYQVGLEEDTDLQNDALKINPDGTLFKGNGNYDKLVFHSNLYDYEHGIAKTWASYKPAADNPFYYETGYSTDSNVAGTTDEYFRLDVIAESAKTETITANTNIVLTDITLSPYNSQATFTYNGQTKTVALSGDWGNGAPWTGEVSIPVTAESTDGIVIEQNISLRINAEMVWQSGRYPYLDLKEVTALEQNATISSDKETATLNLTLKKEIESDTAVEDELVSIYLQIKEDTKGCYIEDTAGNRIDITKNLDGSYTATLGEKNYYSVPYYKYAQGKVSYVEKNLDKGTIAKALVGQFEIIQPGTTALTEDNFKNYFKYYPSNYKESSISYQATDVLFSDGTHWGSIEPDASVTKPAQGTIKVLVSGIQNGQIDVNGTPMIVNFVFTLEEQKLAGGKTQYVVVDCDYWETRDTYAVDMDVSDTAEITADNKYQYDVSYTIESTHASGSANVTQTDRRFFASDFANSIVTGRLGNNGRLSVTADDIYDKDVIAQKEWRDRLGNLIPINDASLKDITISAGIYRVYEYVDAEGNVISHSSSTTNATPYATVELNYENGFKAEWDNIDLPKYLISLSGDYILDRNNNKVPVTYEVAEVTGEDGWVLSNIEKSIETGKATFTLINVPMAEFTPSVEKIWTKDGAETDAPDKYKVRMNLMKQDGANVVPVHVRSESAQQLSVVLSQNSAESNARLNVFYEGGSLTEQEVLVSDFNNENTHKIYKFEYAPQGGLGGTVGSGAHADKVEIHVTVTNTSGDKLGIMNATATFYFTILESENEGTQQSMSISAAPVSSEETGTEKRTVFELRNITTEEVSVVLDGSEGWKHTWENLNLPLLEFDEGSNSYKNVTYSVEEILLVPDESENDGYKEYSVGTNGLIIVPQTSGSRLFKTTYENTEDYQFTVTNDEGLINIAAKKVWLDNNDKYDTRPSKIVFTLYADGVPVDGSAKEISADNAETLAIWNGTANAEWKNVPLYDGTTGKEIEYSVVETLETVAGADKYQTDYTVDDDGTFIVTNRLDEDPAINSTNMEVEKVWIDDNNAAKRRPDAIYMVLYRYVDGQEASTATVVPGTNSIITLTDSVLNGKWENLAKYNEEGKKYIYLVKEYDRLVAGTTEGVSGYEDVSTAADKTETKYTFRNQLEEGSISKTVTKVWNDKALENGRPTSVTVVLSGSISGATAQDRIPVDLTAYQPEQNISEPWSYTWTNLPEFKDGKKIDYAIVETYIGGSAVVDGKAGNYVANVSDDGTGNDFVVTNTLTGETTISVTKVWENIPDGFVIPDVSFDVYNRLEGKKNITLTVTNDNRTATSGSLPKYNANGSEFIYYLIEQPIQETETYRINSVISQNQATDGTFAYTATNTYESLVRDIEGTKTWVDVVGDNIPGNITLKLLRKVNGGTDEVVTKDALGNDLQLTLQAQKDQNNITKNVWNYKFTNLPIFADPDDVSTRYIYSIEETEIGGVPVAQTDYQVNVFGLNITNTLDKDIEGENLDGTKIWTNVNAADVPDSITVELWRNITGRTLERALDSAGNTVAAITVNKPTGTNANVLEWSFDFGDIDVPKYDEQGNEYTYSVKETHVTAGSTTKEVVYTTDTAGTVGDYNVTLNGMNITNTIGTKELVQLPITKAWVAPTSTNLPASITVQLMQDNIAFGAAVNLSPSTSGVTVEKDTETERTRWLYTFTDLPKYASDGITEYKYRVVETHVGEDPVNNGKAGQWIAGVRLNGDFITNSIGQAATTTLYVEKVWKNVPQGNYPDSIKVQLYQNGIKMGAPVEISASTDWKHSFQYLPVSPDGTNANKYTYSIKEISVTADNVTELVTDTAGKRVVGDYVVTGEGNFKDDNVNAATPLQITNTLNTGADKIKTTYPVTKNWIDVTNVPNSITIQLMKNGENVSGTEGKIELSNANAVVNNSNQWTYTFEGLQKYSENGITQHVYTAKETMIKTTPVVASQGHLKAGDFFVSYTKQDKDETIINNRLASDNEKEYTELSVKKGWEGTASNNLPKNITVQLYRGGSNYGNAYTFTNADITNNWSHTFTNLRKYAEDGVTPYVYTVGEIKIGDTVVVYDQGDRTKGTAGDYSVTIGNPVNGEVTITNKLNNTLTDVTVTKTWANVSDPSIYAIKLSLLDNNNKIVDTVTLTSQTQGVSVNGNTWSYKFEGLPKYSDGVTEITYYVREESISVGDTECRVVYDGLVGTAGDFIVSISDKVNITNTLKDGNQDPKDVSVEYTVTKKWDVRYGAVLPNDITVKLTGTGNPIITDTKELTPNNVTVNENTWTYTFDNLRKYTNDGITEYVYSVEETKVGNVDVSNGTAGGYLVTVNGNVISNKLSEQLTTSVSGTKKWVDVSGENIPDYIIIQLYQDSYDNLYEEQMVRGSGSEWSYTFDNLPLYKDGVNKHTYLVKESGIGGVGGVTYTSGENLTGKAGDYEVTRDGLNFTNTLTGTVTLSGKKIWADNSDATDNRPDSINVELYRENDKIAEQSVTGTGNEWAFVFGNYPKYDSEGNLYTYTVKEKGEVNGLYTIKSGEEISHQYRVTYDQENLTITNAIPTTGEAVISGTKTMAGRTFINSDVFKFELKAKTAGAPMPANTIASLNGQDGETTLPVTFGEIVFSKEGTYEYTVEEINDGIGGVTYDDTVWNVTIDVAYSTVDEKYVATVTYGNDANNTGFAFVNNYKAGSVSLDGATNLVVKKEFTGRKDNEWRTSDSFKFTLTATGDTAAKVGTTVILPTNASGITISSADAAGVGVGNFGDIIFTETGIYTFAISEVNEEKGGITYDSHVMNITVNVTDDNSGMLKAAAATTANSNVFKNKYKAENVTAQLSGTKTLTGRMLKDEFSFTISAHSETPNAPMPGITTVTNSVGTETEAKKYVGDIIFPAITYTAPGTYKYTIVENNNNLPGVVYDGQAVTATVVVTDDHEGKLESQVSYSKNDVTADSIQFVNTYSAQATFVTLTGKKAVSDVSNTFVLHDGDFSFKITPAEANPDSDPISETTVSNVGNTFTLAQAAKYTEAGTYYYDVVEVGGNKAGIAYDDTVYEVVVTITDTNAVLSHSFVIKKDGTVIENGTVDNIKFVNTYSPESATAVITGKKVFKGDKPLTAGLFTFELIPVDGAPMPLDVNGQPKTSIFATNDETGIFQFEHIKYNVGGIYKYVVKEVIPTGADDSNNYTLNGITYDPNPHEVTVVITGPIPATGITLNQNAVTVVIGNDITLTAAITPADSTDEVLWASSDESVATIDQNGKVTAVSVGTATVTASVGAYSATCEVTVSNENLTTTDESTQNLIVVETIELDKVEINLAVTAEESLMATVMPEDATDKTVTWNSSDEEVAIVDENGKVTAVADGTAAITAKAGEVEATCLVTVGTGVKVQANEKGGGNEPAPTNLEGDENDSEPTGGGEQASILGGLSKMSPRRFFVTGTNGDGTQQPRANEAKLYATVTYSDGEYVKITNSYDPNDVTIGGNTSVPIGGTKELTGNRALGDGEFSFKIEAVGNAPMPSDDTVENAGDVFSFGTITYDKEGVYYYTITEVNNRIPGITYSEDSFSVKVEVTDEGYDGQLDAKVTYYSAPDTEATAVKFVNNYQAAPTKTQLALTKKLNGRVLSANEFEFKIEAITANAPIPLNATGQVAPIVTNDAAGTATFEEIIFNNAGTYEYKVTEIPGSLKYVTYDKTEYKVTIDVEDDGNGYLEVVKVKVENLTNPNQDPTIEESLVFTNTYKEPSKPKDPKPEEPEDDPKDEPEVYPAPPQPTVSTVAPTGDSANLAGLLGLLGAAVVGFLGIKTYKRKKQ